MTASLHRGSFRAMGTTCAVTVVAEPSQAVEARRALATARRDVAACERVLSRFDPCSDLSRLNRAHGTWLAVDATLIDALGAAVGARRETQGRFDPTILPALCAAGYDRSFELLTERAATRLGNWHAGARIDIDASAGRARIERGAAVDLGGIGKGFAAERALQAMRAAWPALVGALVDVGGDIAVWGAPPEGGHWRVDIADPHFHEGTAGTLELSAAGVATSGRDTRRFGPKRGLHHLINPATGVPAAAGPLSVTVVAPTATQAEAHATALAISDIDSARDHLAAWPDISALFVPQIGEPMAIGCLPLARERPRPRFVITTEGGRFSWL
jgi:FAD:protein FMN transferase